MYFSIEDQAFRPHSHVNHKKHYMYSLSTESSAKEVFIFWTREQGGGGRASEEERMREHDSNLARLEAMSELNKNS